MGFIYKDRFGRNPLNVMDGVSFLLSSSIALKGGDQQHSYLLRDSGRGIAKLLQSRTTKEKVLKNHRDFEAVRSDSIITFVEGDEGELFVGQWAQELPLMPEIGKFVRIYHFYPSRTSRGWIILKRRQSNHTESEEALRAARLLRMYLSRIYSHASTFRTLARKLPLVINEVGLQGLKVDPLLSVYSQYLASSRRFVSSMVRDIAKLTGHEYGQAARLSGNMIGPGEESHILAQHEAILKMHQIFSNFQKDIHTETKSHSKLKEGFGQKNQNIIINLFGVMKNIAQSKRTEIHLAKPSIDRISLLPIFQNLSEYISIHGYSIGAKKMEVIENQLIQIEKLCVTESENGPAILNLLDRIESTIGMAEKADPQLINILASIRSQIVIQ